MQVADPWSRQTREACNSRDQTSVASLTHLLSSKWLLMSIPLNLPRLSNRLRVLTSKPIGHDVGPYIENSRTAGSSERVAP